MIAASTRSKVLVIDDELGPRESLRILLKNEYEVHLAECVLRGLDLLKQHRPDVIIMDIRMPGMSGIEGLREIRKLDPDIAVIMLTGFGALETAQEALRLGANDYLKKPFDTKEIVEVVRQNVRRTAHQRRRSSMEHQLQDLQKHLDEVVTRKERMSSLGEASAELVHDLRNPMMMILGYVQLLAQDIADGHPPPSSKPGETVEYVEAIEANVCRCKDLIESWLDISRNNRMTLIPINLSAALLEIIETVKPLAQTKQVALECLLPPEPIAIMGHGVQLRRAIQNLIVNAIDAMHEPSGLVRITCSVTDEAVELTIADNGEGIEQQHLPHIFKPFYTSKESGKGTGLGLFITQKIIEDHHGSIAIDSTPGCGTRAIVRFPALEAAKSPA